MSNLRPLSIALLLALMGALSGCTDEPSTLPDAEPREWIVSPRTGRLPLQVVADFDREASPVATYAIDWDDGTESRGQGLPRFLNHTYTTSGEKNVRLVAKDSYGEIVAERSTRITALPSDAVQTLQADLAAGGTPLECGNQFRPELLNVTYIEAAVDPRTYGAKFVAHFEGDTPNVDYAVVFYVDGREQMSNTAEGRLAGHVPFNATLLRIFACGGPVGFAADYEASYIGA